MYRIAQEIVRHKVGVVAVLAFAVFVFSDNKNDEAPANPWAAEQPASAAQASSASRSEQNLDGKIGDFARKAGNYAVESVLGEKGQAVIEAGEGTSARFEAASSALGDAHAH